VKNQSITDHQPDEGKNQAGLRPIQLKLAYDGTDFSGWQRQKDARSVQEELEKRLQSCTVMQSMSQVRAELTLACMHWARWQGSIPILPQYPQIGLYSHSMHCCQRTCV